MNRNTAEIRVPRSLREQIWLSENRAEDRLSEVSLARTLFHDGHLDESIEHTTEQRFQLIADEMLFLLEKKELNMGDRFALSLRPEYLGKIHVVELGKTDMPGEEGEVDGLKKEYLDLLDWMKIHGHVKDELSRSESGRTFETREPVLEEARNDVVIMQRNRPLIRTVIEHDGHTVKVFITKRMVFAIPTKVLIALTARKQREELTAEDVMNYIESTLLDRGANGVIPIRTGYYLATDIIE